MLSIHINKTTTKTPEMLASCSWNMSWDEIEGGTGLGMYTEAMGEKGRPRDTMK